MFTYLFSFKNTTIVVFISIFLSLFLSSYRNTREGLGELEKAVETLACGSYSHSISRSPKPHSCFYNSIETRKMFSIS